MFLKLDFYNTWETCLPEKLYFYFLHIDDKIIFLWSSFAIFPPYFWRNDISLVMLTNKK